MARTVVVQSLSCVWFFATPSTAARQTPLSFTISWSLLKFRSIALVMLSNHLILCLLLLLMPSIFLRIRVFSHESALRIRWPKYRSICFSKDNSGCKNKKTQKRDWLEGLGVLSWEIGHVWEWEWVPVSEGTRAKGMSPLLPGIASWKPGHIPWTWDPSGENWWHLSGVGGLFRAENQLLERPDNVSKNRMCLGRRLYVKEQSQEFASCSSQRPTWAQHLNFGSDTRMEKVVGSHWTLCRLSFDTGRICHITWIMLKAIILCLSARLFSLHLSATNPWSLLITPGFTGYFRKLFLCWQLSLAWPEHTSADRHILQISNKANMLILA